MAGNLWLAPLSQGEREQLPSNVGSISCKMAGVEPHIEEEETKEDAINLGFLELTDGRLLKSHLFPSKVGGWPAWLSLSPLPTPEHLCCQVCRGPCIFLLQVYAPINHLDRCFHRTIYLFVCRNPECNEPNSARNFRVFRSQLPRINRFYSSEPPVDESTDSLDLELDLESDEAPCASMYHSMCIVCGSAGPKRCGGCLNATYCGKEHQALDWKLVHKKVCKSGLNIGRASREHPNVLFKEFELVTDAEEMNNDEAEEDEDGENSEVKRLRENEPRDEKSHKDYSNMIEAVKGCQLGDKSIRDLESFARNETSDDKEFLKFKERIRNDPEQVVRYHRGGQELWVSSENKPTKENIPHCPACGAPRIFEFQVMPQLLVHLDVDNLTKSIDWGILAIYTCSDSCEIDARYVEEYLW